MKDYKEFKISFIPFNVDLVSGALWDLEILGINEFDDYLTIFNYEGTELNKESISSCLDNLVAADLISSYSIDEKTIKNMNWNAEWESKINVIEVSDRLVIKPSFREYEEKEGQTVIIIDPKMSFGTGEHQTTKLMLQLIDKYIRNGDKVLDVGSGTAILGIAASKLGAEKVIAVDNDEWCYINGKENAERNNIENIDIINGTIEDIDNAEFDLVIANINKNVLLDIRHSLLTKTLKSGILLLSGILQSDQKEIERQFIQIGFTALEYHRLDEWIGIVLKKN